MHASPVWQRHLDITPVFHEDFLSSWNTYCDDLFSTCLFPTVWRGWLKEQLKWSKRYFCYHWLNCILQAHIITEKKQRTEALVKCGGEIETGEREEGSLLAIQALLPVEKDIEKSTIFLCFVPLPTLPTLPNNKDIEKRTQVIAMCRSTKAVVCVGIWSFMWGKEWEEIWLGAVTNKCWGLHSNSNVHVCG